MFQSKPLCYFGILKQHSFCFFDNNFNPLDKLVLNGYYSFIHYKNPDLFVISELKDYASHHGGLAAMVQVIKQQTAFLRNYFFSTHTKPFFLPKDLPDYGGGLLFLNQQVVGWHLKCRSFSFSNTMYHDTNPQLPTVIAETGLPVERFISVKAAERFELMFMTNFLKPNGQYLLASQAISIAQKICHLVALPAPGPAMPYSEGKLMHV